MKLTSNELDITIHVIKSQSFHQHSIVTSSVWIKLISNNLDIIIHVIKSQLLHQQSIVTSSAEQRLNEWDMGTMCKDLFIVIYGFVVTCKKWNYICYLVTNLFLCSLECYFGVYFPRCFATREIQVGVHLMKVSTSSYYNFI